MDLTATRSHGEGGSDSGIEDPAILSEEGDTVPNTIIRAGDYSPKHRHGSWDARFPRTMYESEFLGFGQHHRVHGRRMSDPGRLSLSPNRSRARIRHGLSDLCLEEEAEDDDASMDNPRLHKIRDTLLPMDDTYVHSSHTRSLSPGRSRPRERVGLNLHRRSQRSFSLPNSDGAVIEINEAIGALAVSGRVPEPFLTHSLHVPSPGRRRSISMEPAFLEVIAEESNVKTNRRFSASHLD